MTNKSVFRQILETGCAVLALGVVPVVAAHADEAKAPGQWSDSIKVSAYVDGGVTGATRKSSDGKNFGRAYDDVASGDLNQATLTIARAFDPAATDYDIGFKIQGSYGSDLRYARVTHEFSNLARTDRNQFGVTEFNINAHTPWLTEGGTDVKVGRFTAPEGVETFDPTNNNFYSHSYIYNYAVPTLATGLLVTNHTTSLVDLYLGLDTGINASVDHGLAHSGNGAFPAITGGVGLNLMGGDLAVVGLTHIGAETPTQAINTGFVSAPTGTDSTKQYRESSDITTVWKVTKQLTLSNDLNWVHDDAIASNGVKVKDANAYGIAQYIAYALTDEVTVAGRGEWFRDGKGVFVFQSGNNSDFIGGEAGQLPTSTRSVTSGRTTNYGALTLGVNYKPALGLDHPSALTIRPEVRYDDALNGAKPFGGNKAKSDQMTVGVDAILQF